MTIEQSDGACTPSFSSAELERLIDEWADAAGHIWVARSGEQSTAWHVRREDLAQLARVAMLREREACAKVCDDRAKRKNDGFWTESDWNTVCAANEVAADAIRARSNAEVSGRPLADGRA